MIINYSVKWHRVGWDGVCVCVLAADSQGHFDDSGRGPALALASLKSECVCVCVGGGRL